MGLGVSGSIGLAGLALSAAGTVASVIGSEQNAAAQKQAADYQAAVARNNAIIANQNADATTKAGQVTATTTNLRSRALLGAIAASEGASGVDVNTGSAADTRATQREMGVLDTETQVSNAAIRAYGYRAQGTGFTAESELDAAKAKQAGTAGDIAATTGLLGGASSLGLKFAQLQNVGAFGGAANSTPSAAVTNYAKTLPADSLI